MSIFNFNKRNKVEILPETEFLPIKKADLLPTIYTNRRLVFGNPGTGKSTFYRNPIAAAYLGRVILITSSNNLHCESVISKQFQHYKPDELELLNEFEKIVVIIDISLSEDTHEQYLEKVKSFINRQPKDVLIIIDEAMAVFGKHLTDFISCAPENCIVILQSIYQLPEFFIEKKKMALEILKINQWNIISLEGGPFSPEWNNGIEDALNAMGIPYQRFRMR